MHAGVVALNLLFTVAGTAVLYGAHGWRTWRALIRELALGYMVGLASVGTLGTLALIVGLPFTTAVVVLLFLLVAACGTTVGAALRRPLPRVYGGAFGFPRTLGQILTALAIGVTVVVAASFYVAYRHAPLIAYDAWNFWVPKAKAIYFFHGIDGQLFRSLPAPSYPLFVPTLDAMVFRFTGATDATALAQQDWFLLAGFIGATASLLAPIARRGLVWLFLALFLVVPELQHRWFQLLADWPLDAFFALSAILIMRWLRTRETWLLSILPLMLAATFVTKREGQLLVVCLLGAALAATWRNWRQTCTPIVGCAALAFVVSQLPWRLWRAAHHVPSDLEGGVGGLASFHRAISSTRIVADLMFSHSMWLLAVPLGVVAALAAALSCRDARRMAVFYFTAGSLAFLGWVWVIWSDAGIPLDTNPALNPIPRAVASLAALSLTTAPVFVSAVLADRPFPFLERPAIPALRDIAVDTYAWVMAVRPTRVLAALVVVQWIFVGLAAAKIRHAGWIFYQGGDQLWYYTSGWLLGHGHFTEAGVGYLWSLLLAPIGLAAGPNLVSGLPAIIVLDVVLLLPVAMLATYGIAARIAGRLFGYWAACLWLLIPFIGVWFTDAGYHQRYTELLLPQAFGLTAMADFPAMVATVVSAYFCVRLIDERRAPLIDGAAAGVAAGAALAIKPSAALFLLAPLVALPLARQFRGAAAAAAGIVPALITMTFFKWRGLGHLPVAMPGGTHRVAAGLDQPLVAIRVPGFTGVNWAHFVHELDLIREHFWSGRLIEWLIVAGAIAILRLAPRIGVLVVVWFAAYAIGRGTYPHTSIEDGSLLRLMIPAYPAFVLMIASLPFLVPGLRRPAAAEPLVPRLDGRMRLRLLVAAVVITSAVPLVAFAAAKPDRAPEPRALFLASPPIPNDVDLGLTARTAGRHVVLSWSRQDPIGGPVFFHVFRAQGQPQFRCSAEGDVDRCDAPDYADLGQTFANRFADRVPEAGVWTYRVGVAANWLNDPQFGDVYLLSTPLTVTVH